MVKRIKKLFPKEEKQQRVLAFLKYFEERQKKYQKCFKDDVFVYIEADILRTMLGRRTYKHVIEKLVNANILSYTKEVFFSKYNYKLHTFDTVKGFNLKDFSPTKKRVITSLEKAYEIESTVDIKTPEVGLVVEQLEVTDQIGNVIPGKIKEDNFSGRLHTPISMMSKKDRVNCRIDGEKLVGVDISSCQPAILRNILNDQGIGKDFVDAYDENQDVYKVFWDFSLNPNYNRDLAKKRYFKIVYSDVNSSDHMEFCKKFPLAGSYLTEIKSTIDPCNPSKKIYSNLCRDLQVVEVALFKEVWMELYSLGIKFAPVHDCVYVKESECSQVISIVLDKAKKYINNPKVKLEV